ncbi:MAG: hypothetical protein R2880_00335 [Deinococcales bacterium]
MNRLTFLLIPLGLSLSLSSCVIRLTPPTGSSQTQTSTPTAPSSLTAIVPNSPSSPSSPSTTTTYTGYGTGYATGYANVTLPNASYTQSVQQPANNYSYYSPSPANPTYSPSPANPTPAINAQVSQVQGAMPYTPSFVPATASTTTMPVASTPIAATTTPTATYTPTFIASNTLTSTVPASSVPNSPATALPATSAAGATGIRMVATGSQTAPVAATGALSGTWLGNSVNREGNLNTATCFMLQDNNGQLTGRLYLKSQNDAVFQYYGDVQGVVQNGSANIVLYFPDRSYTQYVGNFLGSSFQADYNYVNNQNVVMAGGKATLSYYSNSSCI